MHEEWMPEGWMPDEPDTGDDDPPPAPDRRYVECPKCGNLMAHHRPRMPRIFCGRCGYLGNPPRPPDELLSLDGDEVVKDPRILTARPPEPEPENG